MAKNATGAQAPAKKSLSAQLSDAQSEIAVLKKTSVSQSQQIRDLSAQLAELNAKIGE